MISFPDRVRNILPNYKDTPEKRFFKIAVMLIIATVLIMILAALIAFLLSLRGPDEVLVPDVTSVEGDETDLVLAVQKLQEKGLNARIQLKPSSLFTRGIVMEQRPQPGAVVKSGRSVILTVSLGSVVNSIGDYVGKTVASVKLELQELFSSDVEPLIQILEPVMYVFNDLPAETILEQNPPPGTEVRENEITYLELIVSKGPRGEVFELPDYRGLDFLLVLSEMAEEGVIFQFEAKPAERREESGVIVEQEPEAGEELAEGDTVKFVMTEPSVVEEEQKFGIFEAELPRYPIVVRIELLEKTEERELSIFAMQHPGGKITIPYIVGIDSELVFKVAGEVWGR